MCSWHWMARLPWKGNQGADRFVVGVGTVIEDFSPEQGDTVDLSAILSDVPDATNWFDVLDVVADAGTGSTVLQVHPQGVGKTTTANIRKVTLKGKSLSKQDLLDLLEVTKLGCRTIPP